MPAKLVAILLLIFTTAVWGSTFAITKVILAEAGPLLLAELRFVIATLVLLGVLVRARRQGPLPWREFAWMGLFGMALFFTLQNTALVYTTATDASLIAAAVPAFTAILSIIWLGERITWLRATGIIASIVGVACILLAPGQIASAGGVGRILGNVLMVGAAISWAIYTTFTKNILDRLGAALATAGTGLAGIIFMAPLAAGEVIVTGLWPVSAPVWLAILYMGAIASGLTFFTWNKGLQQMDASAAAVFLNLVPVFSILTAALMLNERLGPQHLAGGALVLVGVYFAALPGPKTDG
ncbi:MAG TPA: DMT family transporter [Firmicutes bacterium]|nr:DMT family transporter [Bacillota bacterium]